MMGSSGKITDFASRKALYDFVAKRLEELRESLESINLDQRLADHYRGNIAMLKEIKETLIE